MSLPAPADAEAAYRIQDAVARKRGGAETAGRRESAQRHPQNGYGCAPVWIVIQRSSVNSPIAALPPKRP